VTIVVSVVVAVVVPPGPIILLLLRLEFAEIAVRVAMGFIRPAIVVNHFVVVPHVIVGVIRVVNTIGVVFAACDSGE
jgi:hypothetical protein